MEICIKCICLAQGASVGFLAQGASVGANVDICRRRARLGVAWVRAGAVVAGGRLSFVPRWAHQARRRAAQTRPASTQQETKLSLFVLGLRTRRHSLSRCVVFTIMGMSNDAMRHTRRIRRCVALARGSGVWATPRYKSVLGPEVRPPYLVLTRVQENASIFRCSLRKIPETIKLPLDWIRSH